MSTIGRYMLITVPFPSRCAFRFRQARREWCVLVHRWMRFMSQQTELWLCGEQRLCCRLWCQLCFSGVSGFHRRMKWMVSKQNTIVLWLFIERVASSIVLSCRGIEFIFTEVQIKYFILGQSMVLSNWRFSISWWDHHPRSLLFHNLIWAQFCAPSYWAWESRPICPPHRCPYTHYIILSFNC